MSRVSAIAKSLGRLGGLARAKRLSADHKKKIAALGGQARAKSLQFQRRVEENFNYLAAVQELQGKSVPVKRVKTWQRRLPGHYG